uniref:Uncharacterized protein n=1 Tax=Parascaris equorum TaxID=6256 RepID=A0A914R9C7_PAREQ
MDVIPREFRAVSRLWKLCWESIHSKRKTLMRLRITATNGKYKLEGWSSVSCKCLEVDQRNVAHLLQALSLVELTDIEWRGWSCYSSLWLGGEAVTRELLVAVAVQEWPITSVKLFGNLQNVTADSLCEFFERIHGVDGGAEVRNISILEGILQDFELPDGVICDRLINAMHSRLSQFYVLPSLLRLVTSCYLYCADCCIVSLIIRQYVYVTSFVLLS